MIDGPSGRWEHLRVMGIPRPEIGNPLRARSAPFACHQGPDVAREVLEAWTKLTNAFLRREAPEQSLPNAQER